MELKLGADLNEIDYISYFRTPSHQGSYMASWTCVLWCVTASFYQYYSFDLPWPLPHF